MTWRLARSLDVLRSQINTRWPARKKDSDGTIGDEKHASRNSDHNPHIKDGMIGVVTALDITHDPAKGPDAKLLAEALRESKDTRIKYIISNGHIFSSKQQPWVWRPYSGSNQHFKHVHISVMADKVLYDDVKPFKIEIPIND